MLKMTYSTFAVSRFFMALCVFFCHVFESFNNFGFLFVGVFFFMSGYGMEISGKRYSSLKRLVPYILYFVWFSLIYFLVFRVFIYPSSWFLVMYFMVMLIYRFISNIYGLLTAFCCLGCVLILLDFNWVWVASYGAFLFGVFFARNRDRFTLDIVSYLVPGVLLVPWCPAAFWCLIPLFSYFVFTVSSLEVFKKIACLGDYTFYFYCSHCFCLGVFGATWTLGGSPAFVPVFSAFVLSCFVSVFFKDYLFNYPRIQQ